jgi:DNA sulfur modification protein DndD
MLKDLKLDFSTDPDKPLTVIRAANETGKTTCLNALMWCLYGESVLPSKSQYTLFPNDLKSTETKSVVVSVEIEFQIDRPSLDSNNKSIVDTYRINRRVTERITAEGIAKRYSTESVDMYQITADGTNRVLDTEASRIIENALPQSLKDVYFTDGDSVMSFIEASANQSAKRRRVSKAIEALLGLEYLDSAIKRVEKISKEFSKSIDDTDYSKEVRRIEDQIEFREADLEEEQEKLDQANEELKLANIELDRLEKRIEIELKKGDKSELVDKKDSLKRRHFKQTESAQRDLNSLAMCLYSESLAKEMLRDSCIKGFRKLKEMSDHKQLPKVNIPILEELLGREECFCGSNINVTTDEGLTRHKKIKEAIEDSRSSDRIQEVATSLYYRVRSISFEASKGLWVDEYSKKFEAWSVSSSLIADIDSELKAIDKEIDAFGEGAAQLPELRGLERSFKFARDKANSAIGSSTRGIASIKESLKELEEDLSKATKKLGKRDSSADKFKTAKLIKKVLQDVVVQLKGDELVKVSYEMNRIFLEMIGASPDENDFTQITRAELTKDFDIMVYGASGAVLNPDEDLNGASRRAITLAFILALTKVSEVEAPNVIDTPLGMMAGYVKQSCLNQTLKEGSQIILFLTHSEIYEVEPILDKKAGVIFTLTNPAHYPKMLKNKPPVEDFRIIRCECNHRSECEICARKDLTEA